MQIEIDKCQRIPNGQSKTDNPEKLATQGTQDEETLENIEWAIKNGQSRETGNIRYTRRRKTKQKHNTNFAIRKQYQI